VLLVNCDDLGMHTSINMAVLDAVRHGIATSTSVMVPGPAAPHAFRLLHRSPQIPFGIHLTLTRDRPSHAWRPVSPPEDVPSIVDDAGLLLLGSDASTLLSLPAGLTEWAVHPAVGPPTAQQIDLGWDVRVSDHEFLVSTRAADTVTDEGIVLVDYRRIQDAWNMAANTASRPPYTASP